MSLFISGAFFRNLKHLSRNSAVTGLCKNSGKVPELSDARKSRRSSSQKIEFVPPLLSAFRAGPPETASSGGSLSFTTAPDLPGNTVIL